jgi:hypothetical protein
VTTQQVSSGEGNPPPPEPLTGNLNYIAIEDHSSGLGIARFTRGDNFQLGDTSPVVADLIRYAMKKGYRGEAVSANKVTQDLIDWANRYQQDNDLGGAGIDATFLRHAREDIQQQGFNTTNTERSPLSGRQLVAGEGFDPTLIYEITGPSGGVGFDQPPGGQEAATQADIDALAPGIMDGGTVVRITAPGEEDIFGVSYTVGSVSHVYTFSSLEDAQASLGSDFLTSGQYNVGTLAKSVLDDPNNSTWLLGDADAFVGQEGNYQVFWDDALQDAAFQMGIRDPGVLGRFAADPEIQNIIARGEAREDSPEAIRAEVRRTTFYRETLYPGIETFEGFEEPEQAWKKYHGDVEEALEDLGYERDPDGTYRSAVGDMLDAGIDEADFVNFAPSYIRAKENTEFASSLNQASLNVLGKPIDFNDMMDVLEGTASPELQSVVEQGIIDFQAGQVFSGAMSPEQVARIAAMTNLSESQIMTSFTTAEQALLGLSGGGLEKVGVTEEDLVSAAFNLEATSGRTPEEIRRLARKGALELGVLDDPKAHFFVGFTPEGAPKRQGLQGLRPEAG